MKTVAFAVFVLAALAWGARQLELARLLPALLLAMALATLLFLASMALLDQLTWWLS